jgi:hypothetical protein
MYYSELAEIFEREELHAAIEGIEAKEGIQEKIFNPREHIPNSGEHVGSVIYVARGTIIEKDGDYDDVFAR